MNTIDLKGDDQTFREIVSRTIDSFIDDALTKVGEYSFQSCTALTTIDLPAATSIDNGVFQNCSNLTTIDLPAATSIGNSVFYNCTALTAVDFPAVTSIGKNAFSSCTALTTIDLPAATSIGNGVFQNCTALTTLILRNTSKVATLSNTNAFSGANSAIIYVPDALVDSYKAASNWRTYASRIKGLSELPA